MTSIKKLPWFGWAAGLALIVMLLGVAPLIAKDKPASQGLSTMAAKGLSGEKLIKLCKSKALADNKRCIGYIEGIIDYHILIRSLGTAPTVDFCIDPNLKLEAVVVRVVDYLDQYRMNGPFIAAPGVSLALFDAFPCP